MEPLGFHHYQGRDPFDESFHSKFGSPETGTMEWLWRQLDDFVFFMGHDFFWRISHAIKRRKKHGGVLRNPKKLSEQLKGDLRNGQTHAGNVGLGLKYHVHFLKSQEL